MIKGIPVPGFVDKMHPGVYHRQLSLSAGGAIDVMVRCPAYYHHTSPWGPAREYVADLDFAIGTAVHLAVLEPDEFKERTTILSDEFDSYRKAEAQRIRDEASAMGKTPLLAKHVFKVAAMRESILANPLAKRLLAGTVKERSYFWIDGETGTPCKMRVDALAQDGSYMVDVKTTENAQKRAIERIAASMRWPQRAAWYVDGFESVTGCAPDDYFFLCVETDPPHCVKVYRLSERAIHWGRILNRKAVATVAECLRSKMWPDYGADFETIELPSWEESYLEDQRVLGAYEVTPPHAEKKPRKGAAARNDVSPFV